MLPACCTKSRTVMVLERDQSDVFIVSADCKSDLDGHSLTEL